jgi:hypothetical protein
VREVAGPGAVRAGRRVAADLVRPGAGASHTIDAYGRGLAEYLQVCERDGIELSAAAWSYGSVTNLVTGTRPSLDRR